MFLVFPSSQLAWPCGVLELRACCAHYLSRPWPHLHACRYAFAAIAWLELALVSRLRQQRPAARHRAASGGQGPRRPAAGGRRDLPREQQWREGGT